MLGWNLEAGAAGDAPAGVLTTREPHIRSRPGESTNVRHHRPTCTYGHRRTLTDPGEGTCKALYTGSIPVAASEPLILHNWRSEAIFVLSAGHPRETAADPPKTPGSAPTRSQGAPKEVPDGVPPAGPDEGRPRRQDGVRNCALSHSPTAPALRTTRPPAQSADSWRDTRRRFTFSRAVDHRRRRPAHDAYRGLRPYRHIEDGAGRGDRREMGLAGRRTPLRRSAPPATTPWSSGPRLVAHPPGSSRRRPVEAPAGGVRPRVRRSPRWTAFTIEPRLTPVRHSGGAGPGRGGRTRARLVAGRSPQAAAA